MTSDDMATMLTEEIRHMDKMIRDVYPDLPDDLCTIELLGWILSDDDDVPDSVPQMRKRIKLLEEELV